MFGGPSGSARSDDLDSLLAEFDAVTSKQAELHQSPESETDAVQDTSSELDDLLREFGPSADQRRITALEGEIGSLRSAELERQSRADFEGFSKKLQSELGPNVDGSFARTNLLAALAERPELAVVWQHRHITDEQIRAAEREFQQLEVLHMRAQQAPDDPRKRQAIAALEQRGYQLGLMLNSRKSLNDVWRDVKSRASKVAPPIDPEATADRDAIAQFIRDGQGPTNIPEPPVQWGRLSANEGRQKVKDLFGFDPGWGH